MAVGFSTSRKDVGNYLIFGSVITEDIRKGKEYFLQSFMNLKGNYLLQNYSVFYTDVNSILNLD